MSDVMKLAIEITAIDMLSSVIERVKKSVISIGGSTGKVKQDFDNMAQHITAGLKAIAVSSYALSKVKPGVTAAADMQEAIIAVKLNLMEAGKNASELNAELAQVKSTAIDVSKIAPFSAQEVVEIENTFLKAGLALKDVTAKGGAAWAATALATISKEAPATIADAMVMMAVPFNIKGGQFADLANWLQKVDAASVTTIPELMEGMKYVSGTAAVMKVSWQDTLQALGVLAQSGLRGSMGGTALNDFLLRLTGTSRETRKIMKELNHFLAKQGGGKVEFFDKAGKLKGLPTIIKDLREAMSKLNDKQQLFVMEKIFGEQGGRAALALMKQGEGSWENIGEAAKKQAELVDKLNESLKAFNASLKATAGTGRTTLGQLFTPLLDPLRQVSDLLNDILGKIGQATVKSPLIAKSVSYGAAGLVGAAGAYGLWRLGRGAKMGTQVLKGAGGIKGLLGGMFGTAAGVAKGKAVEAATGVTPVFVTNWPASFGGAIPMGPSSLPGWASPKSNKPKTGGIRGFLGRLAGTAAGVAKGTVAGVVTGATPVFVTNWPTSFDSGGLPVEPSSVPEAVKSKTGASMKKIPGLAAKSMGFLASGAGALTTAAITTAMITAGTAIYSANDVRRGGDGKNWISNGVDSYLQKIFKDQKSMGDRMYDWLHKEGVKNTINITVDRDGNVKANSDNMNTKINNSNRGKFDGR